MYLVICLMPIVLAFKVWLHVLGLLLFDILW